LLYSIFPGDTVSFSLNYYDSVGAPTTLAAYGEAFNLTTTPTFDTTNLGVSSAGVFQWIPDSTAARNHPYIITFRGSSGSPLAIQNDMTIRVIVIGEKQYCNLTALPVFEVYAGPPIIFIAPNPFSTYTKITLIGSEKMRKFRLFDLLGREVGTDVSLMGSELTLNRGNLSNGLYIYEVSGTNKFYTTGKLIVR